MTLWLAVWMASKWECPWWARPLPLNDLTRPLICTRAPDRGWVLSSRREEAERAGKAHHPDALVLELRGARAREKALIETRTLELEP